MTRIMRPRENNRRAQVCGVDSTMPSSKVIARHRPYPPSSSSYSFSSSPFFALPPRSPSPLSSSSSARASYFERGIRGRNRKRHGRVSNRYSIAVSPRTGPNLSARSTISNSLENFLFPPFPNPLEIFLERNWKNFYFYPKLEANESKKIYNWTFQRRKQF